MGASDRSGAQDDAIEAMVHARAVDLLRRIGTLMTRLGRTAEFAAYAAEVRAANARRPAFLALFDAAQLAEGRPALRMVEGARSS